MTPSPQKLTAEGWSEKLFPVNPLRPEVGFDLRKDVAAAIQQAMDQARQEGFESGLAKQLEIQQIRERQAFERARELAAKLMEDNAYKTQVQGLPLYTSDELATLIRALQPPIEGAG